MFEIQILGVGPGVCDISGLHCEVVRIKTVPDYGYNGKFIGWEALRMLITVNAPSLPHDQNLPRFPKEQV
jgi:hypothetical protein